MSDVLDVTCSLTLAEMVKKRCHTTPDQIAYTFREGDGTVQPVTYADLWQMMVSIGANLSAVTARGDRVLLAHPTCKEFIGSFLACLWTGRIAVPVHLPTSRSVAGFVAIARDCTASAVLTTNRSRTGMAEHVANYPELCGLPWIDTDVATSDDSLAVTIENPVEIAFLQYTSGSTGTPRGVQVRHDNLAHNLARIAEAFGHTRGSGAVFWLPHFHDMGLIGGLLQPLYADFPATLLSPTTFIRDPLTWLQTISETRATSSGGPNFAYEMCLRAVSREQAATLDLSCWKAAFIGAEPVNPSTLDRFAKHFAVSGFAAGSLFPCYGLAEATLYVSGGPLGVVPRTQAVPADDAENSEQVVVSCGPWGGVDDVRIVDPETRTPFSEGRVGEVWLAGPSITQGYWGRSGVDVDGGADSDYHGRLSVAGSPATSYLRTGDLGFVEDGELYITGRLKDMIIVRGRNLFPQDVERVIEEGVPSVRVNGSLAFSVPVDGEERLVVLVEVDARSGVPVDSPDVASAVRETVSAAHQISVHHVAQVRPGRIPRTTSGKRRRRDARREFIARTSEGDWT
jgi:acyl-CoA synthetase (AMP-forming)/AMP-acid ligase II